MSTEVRWRKGSTAEHNTFTGALAEVTVDTDKKTLVVHDGVTVGGSPLLTRTDLSERVLAVDSVADLSGFVGEYEGQQVSVKGYHAGSDIGGGIFYWDTSRTSENDGGTVFNGWVRVRGDYITPQMFGATGTSAVDSTAAIQAAFDSPGLAPIFFPRGTYKVTGTGAACLTLTKNRNLIGVSRASTIRADSVGANTSLLRVNITDNEGFLDVRGWQIRDLSMFFNGGGKHCLHFEGGFSIVNATISGLSIAKGSSPDGYGLYVHNQLSHCTIERCGFDVAYMKCFDANIIRKCLTFGAGVAVTFDCELGVRNNTVADNTLVNRDGAVHIINGDNCRILNNQIELAQGLTPNTNQSPTSSMVWVQGVDRVVPNTIIENNNFGGGTNLDHLIYLDNAQRTVIEKNNFIAVNVAEVYLTENAQFNIVGRNNNEKGSIVNPRVGTLFKAAVVDLGVGNMGTLKTGATYAVGDWSGSDFWKDEMGVVHFIGTFSAGTTTSGTVMASLPNGYHPYIQPDSVKRNMLTYTEQLDNTAWFKAAASITANNATAPDGALTADLITANSTTAGHYVNSPAFSMGNSTQYAVSFYLKQGAAPVVRYELNDASTAKWVRGLVDFTAGTVSVSANGTYYTASSASIENVGAGWYRISVVVTTAASGAASTSYSIGVTPNNVASIYTSYLGNPSSHSVQAWGYQAEQGGSVTAYQRVVDAATFETVFASRKLVASTSTGVGYVDITRQGVVRVGNLPTNAAVGVESFQASSITN